MRRACAESASKYIHPSSNPSCSCECGLGATAVPSAHRATHLARETVHTAGGTPEEKLIRNARAPPPPILEAQTACCDRTTLTREFQTDPVATTHRTREFQTEAPEWQQLARACRKAYQTGCRQVRRTGFPKEPCGGDHPMRIAATPRWLHAGSPQPRPCGPRSARPARTLRNTKLSANAYIGLNLYTCSGQPRAGTNHEWAMVALGSKPMLRKVPESAVPTRFASHPSAPRE